MALVAKKVYGAVLADNKRIYARLTEDEMELFKRDLYVSDMTTQAILIEGWKMWREARGYSETNAPEKPSSPGDLGVPDPSQTKEKYLNLTRQLHRILDYGPERSYRIISTLLKALAVDVQEVPDSEQPDSDADEEPDFFNRVAIASQGDRHQGDASPPRARVGLRRM